jgi:hypothetical protein
MQQNYMIIKIYESTKYSEVSNLFTCSLHIWQQVKASIQGEHAKKEKSCVHNGTHYFTNSSRLTTVKLFLSDASTDSSRMTTTELVWPR